MNSGTDDGTYLFFACYEILQETKGWVFLAGERRSPSEPRREKKKTPIRKRKEVCLSVWMKIENRKPHPALAVNLRSTTVEYGTVEMEGDGLNRARKHETFRGVLEDRVET